MLVNRFFENSNHHGENGSQLENINHQKIMQRRLDVLSNITQNMRRVGNTVLLVSDMVMCNNEFKHY